MTDSREMHNGKVPQIWKGLLPLLLVYLLLRILFNTNYGFHRDEFLYLAQGQHLDWGFWSNPPLPGFISYLVQHILGDSIGALRFAPAVLAMISALLCSLTARELGAGKFGQFLAAFSMMVSGAYMRVFLMYNPVGIEVFFWTLYGYLYVRYLRRNEMRPLLVLGLMIGVGALNKYSVVFLVLPLLMVFIFSDRRKILVSRQALLGVGLGALVFFPNFFWQWNHDFPVLSHMEALRENQLQHVSLVEFLVDQLLFNVNILFVWVVGLYYFLSDSGRRFRGVGYLVLGVILLLIVLKGKSYYTLGIYPLLIAGGAYQWDIWSRSRRWLKFVLPALAFLLIAPLSPFGWPYLSPDKMIEFGHAYGPEAFLRWEDGEIHDLPQDYADMFGWEELAEIVHKAYAGQSDPTNTMIYGSNYGQAGAVEYYGKHWNIPQVHSFSDSWILWLPENIPSTMHTLIYINDELGEDVNALFSSIEIAGAVKNTYAREKGTTVYVCSEPRSSLAEFFNQRMNEERSERGI